MTEQSRPPATDQTEAEFLASYTMSDYERPSVTVDLAIFTIRDGVFSVLLIERGDHPFKGNWALPGGFVNPKESTDTAAWRELGEETGVEQFSGHLEQLKTYSEPGRDPRGWVISVAHVAFAPNLPDPQFGDDAADARWWAVEELNLDGEPNPDAPAPALAFDHAEILRDAVERVRSKIEYTTLATEFVGETFTLPELLRVYKAVWGTGPDLGNFRRKVIKTAGFVDPTPNKADTTAVGGRPPLLYRKGHATTLQPAMLRPGTDPTGEPSTSTDA